MLDTVPGRVAGFVLLVIIAAACGDAPPLSPSDQLYESCAEQFGEGTERATDCVREVYCSEQWFMTADLSEQTRSALLKSCLEGPDVAGAADACREATGGDPSCDFDQPNYDPPPG